MTDAVDVDGDGDGDQDGGRTTKHGTFAANVIIIFLLLCAYDVD
jgi:hypothetical protein